MNLLFSLFHNIFKNLDSVKQDYIGFNINTNVFVNILINLTISLILVFISYLIGNKLRQLLFKETSKYSFNYLISIALGYIFVSTGIALLGFLNILKNGEITLYLFLISTLALFPKKSFVKSVKDLLKSLNLIFRVIKKEKTIYAFTILFILLCRKYRK